jgi:glucose-6-phosphate 1-dehydrogenase
MTSPAIVMPSDALVFFGATGDLAYEQIFPSLLGLVRDEGLDVPIVGVAKSGWGLDQLKERAKASLARYGAVNPPAQDKLLSLLRYVDGDYADPATFANLCAELGEARRPLNYLAVPPSLFGTVAAGIEVRHGAGCAAGYREAVRPRPRIGQSTQRDVAKELPGGEHFSH